jgi:hypothetical protein
VKVVPGTTQCVGGFLGVEVMGDVHRVIVILSIVERHGRLMIGIVSREVIGLVENQSKSGVMGNHPNRMEEL